MPLIQLTRHDDEFESSSQQKCSRSLVPCFPCAIFKGDLRLLESKRHFPSSRLALLGIEPEQAIGEKSSSPIRVRKKSGMARYLYVLDFVIQKSWMRS